MITVTINHKKIELEEPLTILEAAKLNGIHIPTFCHHPVLELWGGCRLCLVEIEKMPRLQTACTVRVTDGMAVYTESPKVVEARKAVIEFLLINHPLQCPVCDKAGECDLQDLTVKYGAAAGRFEEGKRTFPENVDDPIIVRNMERCILCTRCVRMCDGVQGASAIAVTARGNRSRIEPVSGGRYNCEYCGNCLSVCPVGAVMSKLHRYSYRPWQMDRTVQTVCGYCGVGCTLNLEVRDETIKKSVPVFGKGVNKGLLCSRGRFGYEFTGSEERLTTPLVKRNGQLEPASWDEALDLVARRFGEIKGAHGGASIGAIASARCTNEENYLLQKLMRAGLQSNNIDSIARMGLLPAQRLLEEYLGQGAAANIIAGITRSEAVVVIAGDPTRVNPVMGLQVRAAAKAGKKVITIGFAPGLRKHKTGALAPYPGEEGPVVAALLRELAGHAMPGENKDSEQAIKGWELPEASSVEKRTGVAASEIAAVAEMLKGVPSSSIIVGREFAANGSGKRNMALLAALSYVLNGRVFLMSERPNEQGLIEIGCSPDMLPGERPLELESFRKRYEEIWGVALNPEKGLTLMEMIEAAGSRIKALYIMGENPVYNLPGGKSVKDALGRLDFLVVQDIFMTETAAMADVVLPALGWAEKEGTYINLEKRMQVLKKALNKNGMEDWKILAGIGKRLSLKMPFESAADIMKEIAHVSHIHAGLDYAEVDEGLLWPYKGEPLRTGGKLPSALPAAGFDAEAPGVLKLMIDKPLFHSGTISRYSKALLSISGGPVARVCARTGAGLGLEDGCTARISTDNGSITLNVKFDEDAPEGVLLLGNNFKDAGAMGLMGYRLEPETKIPVIEPAKNLKVERI